MGRVVDRRTVRAPTPLGLARVGQAIREHRRERGLTQSAAAARAGVHVSVYVDLERGRRTGSSIEALLAVCQSWGLTLRAMVRLTVERPPVSCTITRTRSRRLEGIPHERSAYTLAEVWPDADVRPWWAAVERVEPVCVKVCRG